MRTVRGVKLEDADAIWRILEPMVRAGETYPLPREMNKDEALAYWMGTDHEVFVAEEDGEIVGTYFLKANQKGGGAHVAKLRLCDGRSGSGTRTRADDVPPFDRARERTHVSRDAVQFCGGDKRECGAAVAKLRLSGCGAVAGCIFASKAGIRGCVGDVSRHVRGSVARTDPPVSCRVESFQFPARLLNRPQS